MLDGLCILCMTLTLLITLCYLTLLPRSAATGSSPVDIWALMQGEALASRAYDAQDFDADGLPDVLEQELAEKYAPVVYYSRDEPNLPTSVQSFMRKTELWYYDSRCEPQNSKVCDCDVSDLLKIRRAPCMDYEGYFEGDGTRSKNKQRSLYLKDVSAEARRGSSDTHEWITYFHAYPNNHRGVTIQYWRFYPFNTGVIWGHSVGLASHGGDWEAIHVEMGPAPAYLPLSVHFLGHRSIKAKDWASLLLEGTHPLVMAEEGDHTSHAFKRGDRKKEGNYIRHEGWTGGSVRWVAGHPLGPGDAISTPGGPLLNLGEKTAPMRGMEFLQYSGLWGSRKGGLLLPALRSGYWGPAYNETSMAKDGFITAWCLGMENFKKEARGPYGVIRECYPRSVSR